jgi:uracil-DNA glycosylase family 4
MSDIKFLADNNLNEIITDEPCNYFLVKDQEKAAAINKTKDPIPTQESKIPTPIPPVETIIDQPARTQSHLQIKAIASTSEALSLLAKKSQENMNKQDQLKSLAISLSINDIVKKSEELANKATNLAELRQAVENFDGCNLKKMATNTVFSDGNSASKIMLIGEAPGNNEDLQGIPFCGDSGKLLDEMFKSINLTRNQFYITNTIFWRPPGNRKPTPEELAICKPFVDRHIELVNPKLIILIGATAMSSIINNHEPISKIRGKFLDFAPKYLSQKIKLMTIFHPSYLMRQSNKKKIAWMDMLTIQDFVAKNF